MSVYLSRWWDFIFDEPREAGAEGGVWPSIVGTVVLTMIMTVIAVPFGVLAAFVFARICPPRPAGFFDSYCHQQPGWGPIHCVWRIWAWFLLLHGWRLDRLWCRRSCLAAWLLVVRSADSCGAHHVCRLRNLHASAAKTCLNRQGAGWMDVVHGSWLDRGRPLDVCVDLS